MFMEHEQTKKWQDYHSSFVLKQFWIFAFIYNDILQFKMRNDRYNHTNNCIFFSTI